MPTIVRKTFPVLMETRREIHAAFGWHMRSNIWHPPTDVYETDESVVIKMEIAGMRDEDLEVAVQENTLIISGNRSDSSERRAYHQMEIQFGKFSVGLELPVRVEPDHAQAEYKDGFLTVHLPRKKLEK